MRREPASPAASRSALMEGAFSLPACGDRPPPLRVLHVIPSVSKGSGGPSKAIGQMERALAERGVDVVTATTDDDGDGARMATPLGVPLAHNGATRVYFSRQTVPYKVSLPLLAWLRREVPRFDVVHVHALFSFAPVAAAMVARSAGVPYIIRPLGVLNRYGMVERRSRLKALSVRLLEGRLLRDAAFVHFTAEQEQHEAGALGVPLRGRVVPLGIESMPAASPDLFQEAFPGLGKPRLLFMSRIDPKKNIEALLEALASCRNAIPDISLVICGDGDRGYLAGLKSLAAALGVADCVTWASHVDGPMKASAFAAADLFVLPSFSENFGIAAVEALSAGLPCILGEGVALAGDIAAADAGISVPPTGEAVARAITKAMSDDTWRIQAGARVRQLAASHYSLAAMGKGLVDMYAAARHDMGEMR
jgi:glycosyltransferase involved in cell wall biosynthesis